MTITTVEYCGRWKCRTTTFYTSPNAAGHARAMSYLVMALASLVLGVGVGGGVWYTPTLTMSDRRTHKFVAITSRSTTTTLVVSLSCAHFLLAFACFTLVHLAHRWERRSWLYLLHGVLSVINLVPILLVGILFTSTHAWFTFFFMLAFAVALLLTILYTAMTTRAYQLVKFPHGVPAFNEENNVGQESVLKTDNAQILSISVGQNMCYPHV